MIRIIIGTTVTCFSHSLSISIFRSWYLLIFSSSFSSLLLSPGITNVNYPYPLLLNHSDIWYVVCQVLVRLNLEVPENLNVLLLQNLIDFALSAVGRLYSCRGSSAALMQLCRAVLCSQSAQFCYICSPSGLLSLPLPCTSGILLSLEVLSILALMALVLIA